ncbi:MAG TPA: NADH-quinone oxidoreductase subunit D [Acidobacteriota bacterium]|nr:NADH-quinone oxidoreductase subunit D [Acidobacteriota bacterium]
MLETKEFELNMGPQHPSTHGVLRLVLYLDGETIIDIETVMGYLHRGTEKLCETRNYYQNVPFTDRTDYLAAPYNNLGYVETVERLGGWEVSERALYARLAIVELSRIASHLFWLATHALDIGAQTMLFWCTREREVILDFFEAALGDRLTTSAFRPGGLRRDLPEGWAEAVLDFCSSFPQRIEEYETLLSANRIWLERTVGVGVISGEDAAALGLSGPMIRGSGVDYDIRKALPYGGYDQVEFDVPVFPDGDSYARYLVRMEEMRQSVRITQQALTQMPEGPITAKVPKAIRIKDPVEAYHIVESPRGELGYYIIGGNGDTPYKCKIRAPSFCNLQAIAPLCKGHLIADVVTVIGSVDIVLGDVDR